MDWIQVEPSARAAGRHLLRMWRRAASRWVLTLGITVLLSGMVVVNKAITKPRYPARIALRATESDYRVATNAEDTSSDETVSPRTATRLRDYVTTVVLSDRVLTEVMKRHDVYTSMLRQNPVRALENFRDDLDVQVFRNNFIYERRQGDPPRSARLEIGILHPDPRTGLIIVQELADLVIRHETDRRTERLAQAKALADEVIVALHGEISAREEELADRMVRANADGIGSTRVAMEVRNLQESVLSLQRQLRDAQRESENFDLKGSIDEQAPGLRFERVDWRSVEMPESRSWTVAVAGTTTFMLLLPLLALAIGAFDSRVYDLGDVRRLRLEALGVVRTRLR